MRIFSSTEPDGPRAFFIAFVGMIIVAVVLGISNSYPSMVMSIQNDEKFKDDPPTDEDVALASSLSLGLNPLFGLISGHYIGYMGARIGSIICVVCCAIAVLVTSFAATNYRVVIGVYGIFMAIAVGVVLNVPVVAVATWFNYHKSLGLGILFAGAGVGSVTIPIMAGELIAKSDWRVTMQYLSIFCILGLVCSMFMTLRPEQKEDTETVAETTEQKQLSSESANDNGNAQGSATDGGEGQQLACEERCINTHKATLREWIFDIILTKAFLSLFIAFVLFGLGFYGLLYIIVPYPAFWMGKKGTIYADYEPISIQKASYLFIPFGLAEIVSGPLAGYLAVRFTDRFTLTFHMILHAIVYGLFAIASKYWALMVCSVLMGWNVGVWYAIYPSMIGKRFYGPNIGLTMGLQFMAVMVGGFGGPAISTAMLNKFNNYTPFIAFGAVCSGVSGLIILFFMEDRPGKPIQGEGERQKAVRAQKLSQHSVNAAKTDPYQ